VTRRTELNAVVLDGCNIEEKRGEEYLRVERSSLNSTDEKEKVEEELVAVVLKGYHVE
jgi:hypothetical protein